MWSRTGVALTFVGWLHGLPGAIAETPPAIGSGAVQLAADEARDLCLTEAAGDTPVDAALRAHQELARRLPTKWEVWLGVGWEWVRKARLSADPGFYVNVASCADEAARLAPQSSAPRELRMLVLLNGHRFDEARLEAEKILASEAENPVVLGALSDALLELGRFEEAADAAQRSADIKLDAAGYARASYFRWLTGDKDEAKQFIRSALSGRDRRDPEPAAWTFIEAAKIFWHEGDYAGADAVLEEALKWVPDYPPALVARGRVELSRERPEQAIAYLDKAYRAQPHPETAWLVADARAMLGDAAGVEAASQLVVQAGKRGDRLTLALFYATKNRNIDQALRLIEEERATRGGIYVEDAYAWVLYRAGRIDEARRASDRARRLGTPDARILYHAGAIQMAAGLAEGRGLVEKALAINPKFDWTGAAEARALLGAPAADATTTASSERPKHRDS